MKRKLISWITILAFTMTMLPVLPHAAEAEEATTSITMGTTELEHGKYYSISEDSALVESDNTDYNVYFHSGNVLELNNVTFSGADEEYNCAIYSAADIVIKLTGENTISYSSEDNHGTNYGLYAYGNIYIGGEGSLTISAQDLTEKGTASDIPGKSIGIKTDRSLLFTGSGTVIANGAKLDSHIIKVMGYTLIEK